MSSDYTCKNGLVYKNQYHVTWCPKYRRPILVGEIETRVREILTEVANEMEVTIKAMEIMPDHIHLFLEFDPRLSLHAVVKSMKGRSARVLRSEFPSLKTRLPNLWTRSYFMCTVGHVNENTIKQYIEAQKRHQ